LLTHFSAAAVASSTATAPLDVLRTRLQSDFYQQYLATSRLARGITDPAHLPLHRSTALHIRETFQILFAIPRVEGTRALFKGLGATLVAIVPARGIHFFAYGNSKDMIMEKLTKGVEGPLVHLGAAAIAGAATSTATNPIWVIKTRLQLDKSLAADGAGRMYKNAFDCLVRTVRAEGVTSLYRGLSASFIGISDTCLSWVMYEEAKRRLRVRKAYVETAPVARTWYDGVLESFGQPLAGGTAKMISAFITYPHEVSISFTFIVYILKICRLFARGYGKLQKMEYRDTMALFSALNLS
jgi:solute carrier family 25 protein 33/36